MSRSLERFVEGFVHPMLAGGRVVPQAPYSTMDRDEMARDAGLLASSELTVLRLVRAQALLPHPPVADPTVQELSMWLGLHNLTFLDHPQVGRIWATPRKWELVERETRALFEYARPVDLADAVTRHVAVSALANSRRHDLALRPPMAHEASDGHGEAGQRALATTDRAGGEGQRQRQGTRWIHAPHARAVARLWPVALWASPLTTLLDPTLAPSHWAPSTGAGFLRHRGLARAVVFAWARRRDWIEVGTLVAGAALQELGLMPAKRTAATASGTLATVEGDTDPSGALARGSRPGDAADATDTPESGVDTPRRLAPTRTDASALLHVFAALVHLHVIKLVEFDARVVPARDRATQAFLAMPLLLRALAPRLGEPLAGVDDVGLIRRWDDHVEHLAAIVPGELVASLLAVVTPTTSPRAGEAVRSSLAAAPSP